MSIPAPNWSCRAPDRPAPSPPPGRDGDAAEETSFVSCIVGPYNELVELVRLAEKGYVQLTTTTFPLEDFNDALHALDEGRMVGPGVVVPNES